MLYCIMGNSGTGKTTVVNNIMKKFDDINQLILCTTRPKRESEVPDKDYYFIGDKIFDVLSKHNLLFEERTYEVVGDNKWRYGTLLDDVKDAMGVGKDYITTASKTQFCTFYENMKDYVIPVVLHADNDTRLQRALGRRGNTEIEEEILRRIKNDVDAIDINMIPVDFVMLSFDNTNDTTYFVTEMIKTFRQKKQYQLCGPELDMDRFKLKMSIMYDMLKGEYDNE